MADRHYYLTLRILWLNVWIRPGGRGCVASLIIMMMMHVGREGLGFRVTGVLDLAWILGFDGMEIRHASLAILLLDGIFQSLWDGMERSRERLVRKEAKSLVVI